MNYPVIKPFLIFTIASLLHTMVCAQQNPFNNSQIHTVVNDPFAFKNLVLKINPLDIKYRGTDLDGDVGTSLSFEYAVNKKFYLQGHVFYAFYSGAHEQSFGESNEFQRPRNETSLVQSSIPMTRFGRAEFRAIYFFKHKLNSKTKSLEFSLRPYSRNIVHYAEIPTKLAKMRGFSLGWTIDRLGFFSKDYASYGTLKSVQGRPDSTFSYVFSNANILNLELGFVFRRGRILLVSSDKFGFAKRDGAFDVGFRLLANIQYNFDEVYDDKGLAYLLTFGNSDFQRFGAQFYTTFRGYQRSKFNYILECGINPGYRPSYHKSLMSKYNGYVRLGIGMSIPIGRKFKSEEPES